MRRRELNLLRTALEPYARRSNLLAWTLFGATPAVYLAAEVEREAQQPRPQRLAHAGTRQSVTDAEFITGCGHRR